MFKTLRDAFKIKEIRNKILFTLAMIVVVRIGSQLPVPGVDREFFANWFAQQTSDAFNFLDAFTGGSFINMSLLALNITPYITSSIIVQLLTIAIPAMEEMQKDGQEGKKKLATITRFITVGLALIESTAMAISFKNGNMLSDNTVLGIISIIVALTAGSAFVMWIGERITEKGIGSGISIILLINIIARIPQDLALLFEQFVFNKRIATAVLNGAIIILLIVIMIILVVLLNSGTRKIPVQYARRVAGSKMSGGTTSHIPLKVNTAGVIPVIFASSLLQTPLIVISLFGVQPTGFWAEIVKGMSSKNWCNPEEPIYSIGLLVYCLLTIFFAYFYTSITFNPIELTENLKNNGGFIPGIRPGKPTTDYLVRILNAIIFIGAIGLVIVCALPFFFYGIFGAEISFGGTSLIIIVSVVLETLNQLESQMTVRNYKGFLNQ